MVPNTIFIDSGSRMHVMLGMHACCAHKSVHCKNATNLMSVEVCDFHREVCMLRVHCKNATNLMSVEVCDFHREVCMLRVHCKNATNLMSVEVCDFHREVCMLHTQECAL